MNDRFTVHAVVVGLVAIVLGALGVLCYTLASVPISVEQQGIVLGVVGTIATTSLGAVAGILARTTVEPPVVDPPLEPVIDAR